jgi:hypothetical protein
MGKKTDCATDWLGFAWNSWQLGFEASLVVPLRLARIAQGGAAGDREARLMVSEKLDAHSALASGYVAGRLGNNVPAVASGAARHYLGYVRANRKRLLREAWKG